MLCNHANDRYGCRLKNIVKDDANETYRKMRKFCYHHLAKNGWTFRMICPNRWCTSTLLFQGQHAHPNLYALEYCKKTRKSEIISTLLSDQQADQEIDGNVLTPKYSFANEQPLTKKSVDNVLVKSFQKSIDTRQNDQVGHIIFEKVISSDEISVGSEVEICEMKSNEMKPDQHSFTVLGLDPDVSFRQIKRAYRALALNFPNIENLIWNKKCLSVQQAYNELNTQFNGKRTLFEEIVAGFAAVRCPNGQIFFFESRDELYVFVLREMLQDKDKVSRKINSIN